MSQAEFVHGDYTVGWVCSLEVEQIAAELMLDEQHHRLTQPLTDNNSYTLGSINHHHVVIAGLPTTGNCSAATVIAHMRGTFPRLKFTLLVGIGGGVPSRTEAGHIRLGHVIVSKPSDQHSGAIQYDHGKAEGDLFYRTGSLAPPPNVLLNAAQHLAVTRAMLRQDPIQTHLQRIDTSLRGLRRYKYPGRDNDHLYQSDYTHSDRNRSCQKCKCDQNKRITRTVREDEDISDDTEEDYEFTVVHRGTIASGEMTMRNGQQRDDLARAHGIICFEREAAGALNDFPCLVVRGISDYADSHKNDRWHGYAAAAAAAYARELFFHLPVDEIGDRIRVAESDIQQLKEVNQFGANSSAKANTNIERLDTKFVLSKLIWANGATFDAFEDSVELNALCLDNTRVELLGKLREWIADSKSRPLFWLNGMAGTGKSTISRTLAKELAERKQLGASFFFKEGEGDRGNARRFFSTIAAQLVQLVPILAPYMKDVLELDPYIGTKAIKEQFEKLIIEPLQAVKHRIKSTIILVVDALDECKPGSHIITILNSFSRLRELRPLRVQVFLTSRPEHELRFGFEQIKALYQDILLHEIERSIVTHDIAIYFDYKFSQIRSRNKDDFGSDWPGKVILDTLTQRASPLFIFAATVCRFIGDFKHDPLSRLKSVLEDQDDEAYDKIHNIYRPILERLLEESTKTEQPKILKNFRQIVGPIAVLFEPLSVFALSTLLQIDVGQIKASINGLHSVLNVPKDLKNPVRTLHLSFVEFLLASDRCNEHHFWIDASDIHFHLANRCLDLLLIEKCLKQDICDLKHPGILRADIDDTLIKTRLSAEVQYACRYWTSHLKSTSHNKSIFEDRVIQFLSQRFSFWFEAVSLLGRAQEMVLMISDLSTVFLGSENLELAAVIHNVRRFVQVNCYIVDIAPLQLYSSCAIFSPKQFVNRCDFLPTWLSRPPVVSERWSAAQQILESHSNMITTVLFSPNGKLLVSTSTDKTIKLWDVVSGQLRDTLPINAQSASIEVAFSNRSKLLAGVTLGGAVMVWDVELGQLQFDYQDDLGIGNTLTIVFSHDDNLLLNFAATMIKVWNVMTGQLVYTLEGHLDRVTSIALLHVDNMLISGSDDKTIKLWNLTSGQLDHSFVGDAGHIKFLVASRYDRRLMVSSSVKRVEVAERLQHFQTTIEIWSLESGELQHSFSSDTGLPMLIAFVGSQDEMLVSVSALGTITLWNTASGQLEQRIDIGGEVEQAVISTLGEILAMSSTAGAIEVWRLHENQFQLQQRLAKNERPRISVNAEGTLMASGHDFGGIKIWEIDPEVMESNQRLSHIPPRVYFVVFSPDGKSLASGTGDKKIKIWDVQSGQLHKTICSTSDALVWASFSMDGSLLASGFYFGRECDMHIWDLATRQLIRTIPFLDIEELGWQRDLFFFEGEQGNFWIPGELWQSNDNEWVKTHPQREGHLLFSLENNWLCRKGQRFLWLPPDWRGLFDQYDSHIALGLDFDQVILFEISADELDQFYG